MFEEPVLKAQLQNKVYRKMRALANNTVLEREYWQCSIKLEIISTKELNMNL